MSHDPAAPLRTSAAINIVDGAAARELIRAVLEDAEHHAFTLPSVGGILSRHYTDHGLPAAPITRLLVALVIQAAQCARLADTFAESLTTDDILDLIAAYERENATIVRPVDDGG